MKKAVVFILCVAAIALVWSAGAPAQDTVLKREAKETLLVNLEEFNTAAVSPGGVVLRGPDEVMVVDIDVSPNLRHVALLVEGTGFQAVVLDSEMQETYDEMGTNSLKFSPDGERLIYSAVNDTDAGTEEWYTVVDGVPYGPYKTVFRVGFSPDSKHTTWFACTEDKNFLVKDMVEDRNRLYTALGKIQYSPDGRRMAFATMIGEKMCIVIDGAIGPEFDKIGYLVFSADSRRVAYMVFQGGKGFFVIDGVKSPAYDRINDLVFSPDSKHVCYGMNSEGKWWVVTDGKEEKAYDDISLKKWYSPDSERIAYWAREGKKQFMVINGVEKPVPGIAGGTTFSPDSGRIAYLVQEKKKIQVVVDDTLYGPYRGAIQVIFSPDSSKVAFMAMVKKNKVHVVLDGANGKTYKSVRDMIFSPDSLHLAYGAIKRKDWFVVLDGEEQTSYKEVGSIMFSPAGKHLLYMAKDHKDKVFIVVDGVEGTRYDTIFKTPTPKGQMSQHAIFDTPDSFHYLAMKGNKIYLVEEKVKDIVPGS